MSNIAVRVEDLGKQYYIGAKQQNKVSLIESLTDAFKDPFRRFNRGGHKRQLGGTKQFWALKDVCFELKHGEVLGIIGRNGSGKSTLLKILSNVLDPTTGRVELYGRVGSLLEVGMGFHPELTGRENIYLSGAVMGMPKSETDRKLDDIIDFSGIEEFIDTPVKRYSSGMYVRLAFSVASQLDPEILILDEVLAVGDQIFQKKCLRKMHEVARDGRTVLFVSHSMASVRQLCDRGIMLADGSVIKAGTADEVVDHYLDVIDDSLTEVTTIVNLDDLPRVIARLPPDPVFILKDISITQHGDLTLVVGNGSPIDISIEYQVIEETQGLYVYFQVYSAQDVLIFESLHNGSDDDLPIVPPGEYVSAATIPADLFLPERHELWVGAAIFGQRACVPEMLRLNLEVYGTGRVNKAYPKRRPHGAIAPLIKWVTKPAPTEEVEVPLGERIWKSVEEAPGNDHVKCRSVRIRNVRGAVVRAVDSQEAFDVEIEYWNLKDDATLVIGMTVKNADDLRIITSGSSQDKAWHGQPRPRGICRSVCQMPGNFLGAGVFTITVWLCTYGYVEVFEVRDVIGFAVHESDAPYRGDYTGLWPDLVCPVLPWHNEVVKER